MAEMSSPSDQEIVIHAPNDDFQITESTTQEEAFPVSKQSGAERHASRKRNRREVDKGYLKRGEERSQTRKKEKTQVRRQEDYHDRHHHDRDLRSHGSRDREPRERDSTLRSDYHSKHYSNRAGHGRHDDNPHSKTRSRHHGEPARATRVVRHVRQASDEEEEEHVHKRPKHTVGESSQAQQSSSSSSDDSDDEVGALSQPQSKYRGRGFDVLLRDLAANKDVSVTSSDSDSDSGNTKEQPLTSASGRASKKNQPSHTPGSESPEQDGNRDEEPASSEDAIRRGRWHSGYDEDSDKEASTDEQAQGDGLEMEDGDEEEDDEIPEVDVFPVGSDLDEEKAEVDNLDQEKGEEVEPEHTPSPELPTYFPATMGCRNVENYEWLNRIEEGTYGVVYRAKDKRTGEVVALKKLKMEKEKEGFPITSLREINMLMKAKHPNIVHVREIVVGSNMDKIYIVMDYVEHDLKALMETMKQPFLEGEVKTLMIQLCRAVHHLHDNWILHRDLKASNLLLSHNGVLKVGDFGLAREYGSPLLNYTPVVVTLWYRSPELLLGIKEYSTAVDMWSVGCIFAEFLLHKPLFRGRSEIDQLNQIFKELGTPTEEIWPGYKQLSVAKKVDFVKQPYNNLRKKFPYLTKNGFDLLNRFLTYDPKKRITAEQALQHRYFEESPKPVDPAMFPTWPAKSEMTKRPRERERSPTAPEGGAFLLNNKGEEEEEKEKSLLGAFHLTTAQHGRAAVGAGFSLKF